MKKRVMFGFYKGLGDLITDMHIINSFLDRFDISVYVSSWLKDIAEFLLKSGSVVSYKSSGELLKYKYSYEYIFLTPNYIHPAKLEKRATPLYITKFLIVLLRKNRNSKIIRPSFKELLFHYFQLKNTYLDEHFYIMSKKTVEKVFPEIKLKKPYWKNNQKPEIDRILIFPFSGNPHKDYPLKKYCLIAKSLKKLNLQITFLSTEKDREKLKSLEKEFSVETKSLVDIAKGIRKTDLVISGDTGPAHLSAYMGANLIVLYGYTKPEKYKPLGEGRIVEILSKNGVVKDISHWEIIQKIHKNFHLRGRISHGEQKVVNMYSNL